MRDRRRDDVAHRLVLRVGVGAAGGEQPQEVRLAGPVRAEHGDPVAEPDLEVERLHQPGELELLADDRALAGAAAAQPHADVLVDRHRLRRAGIHEPRSRVSAAW